MPSFRAKSAKKTYREHTRNGSARNVLRWFGKARRLGVQTTVNVTVTRKNLFELYETVASALLAGADQLLMNRFLPGGRGLANAEQLLLTRDEIPQMLDTAEEVLRTANRFGAVGTELPLCFLDPSRYKHLTVGTRCAATRTFFVIGPSGHVRVCNHSPVELHHFRQILQVSEHPYWRRFAMADYLPSTCSACTLRTRCDGGCREAAHVCSGSIDAPDPMM